MSVLPESNDKRFDYSDPEGELLIESDPDGAAFLMTNADGLRLATEELRVAAAKVLLEGTTFRIRRKPQRLEVVPDPHPVASTPRSRRRKRR